MYRIANYTKKELNRTNPNYVIPVYEICAIRNGMYNIYSFTENSVTARANRKKTRETKRTQNHNGLVFGGSK